VSRRLSQRIGCLAELNNQGGFRQKRDIKALVQEIGSWNELIAAVGGKLKDLLGDGPLGVQAAITQYRNFEQLEAAGQDKLPPEYQKLFELIGRVGQEGAAI
jgi:hypothetical protein